METIVSIICILCILVGAVIALVIYAVVQIKLFGINVKDFWSFIEANQILDNLSGIAKKYDLMTSQEQLIYLMEAEKIFVAFDKIPQDLWEEEYAKYKKVLRQYTDIKKCRWAQSQ